jgi:cholesterol transport system auxiliary component
MKYMFFHVVCAVLVATVSGCLSPFGETPKVHTYQLSLDNLSNGARVTDTDAPVLLVTIPQAEPGFETSRMVYVKRPYELEYYAVNQWADTPARMFMPLLVQMLGKSSVWRDVVSLPSAVPADYRLDSSRLALQQEFFQQPSRVRLTARLQFVDLKQSSIVGMRTFEVTEPASSENAYGGVLAANRAVAGLLDQIVAWLQQCVRRSPECGHR